MADLPDDPGATAVLDHNPLDRAGWSGAIGELFFTHKRSVSRLRTCSPAMNRMVIS